MSLAAAELRSHKVLNDMDKFMLDILCLIRDRNPSAALPRSLDPTVYCILCFFYAARIRESFPIRDLLCCGTSE
jgi:hypothetical protein